MPDEKPDAIISRECEQTVKLRINLDDGCRTDLKGTLIHLNFLRVHHPSNHLLNRHFT